MTLRRAAPASGVTVRLAIHKAVNSDFRLQPHFNLPVGFVLHTSFLPPTSGETKERPGASVLRRHGAEAEGEDER